MLKKIAAGFLCASILSLPGSAAAHSGSKVGTTVLEIGWVSEPAYVGSANAVEVSAVHDGQAINDASLKVQVIFGGVNGSEKTEPLTLDPVAGEPGRYLAGLIPTKPGKYTFHITGQVSEDKVDVKVTSGPKTFDTVVEPGALQFPDKLPSQTEIADAVKQNQELVAAAQADSARAQDVADSAKMFALIALVVGFVALAGGVGMSLRKSK